jgi:hypothetical protein
VDEHYIAKEAKWRYYDKEIHFGTYIWSELKREKEDYMMSYQRIQAHKV